MSDTIHGAASAMASVLESLIELLVAKGVVTPGEILTILDVCQWSAEEQGLSPGFSAETKSAQVRTLEALLKRLSGHDLFAAEVARRRDA